MIDIEISKLIDRLRAGTGPDRDIDRAIFEAIEPDCTGEAPEYTGRLVAALSVFRELQPRDLCIAALIEREQLK